MRGGICVCGGYCGRVCVYIYVCTCVSCPPHTVICIVFLDDLNAFIVALRSTGFFFTFSPSQSYFLFSPTRKRPQCSAMNDVPDRSLSLLNIAI